MTSNASPSRAPRALLALSVLGLAVSALVVGGGTAIRSQAKAGQPTLSDTQPVTAPPAPRAGRPDQWAALEAMTGLWIDDDIDRRELLLGQGLPDPVLAVRADPQLGALSKLDALDLSAGVRVPVPDGLDEPFPDLRPLQDVADAAMLRGWTRAEAGESRAGVESMLRAHALGAMLAEGESDLLGGAVGVHLAARAQLELTELLTGLARDDAEALAAAAAGLAPREPGAIARGMADEARRMEQHLDGMADDPALASAWWTLLPRPFDVDQTIAWYRVDMQWEVDRARAPAWERPAPRDHSRWSGEGLHLDEWLYNPVGRQVLAIATPEYGDMVEREEQYLFQERALVVWIAARRHALDAGAPPLSIDALVPTYLDAVPTDPRTGRALTLADAETAGQPPE